MQPAQTDLWMKKTTIKTELGKVRILTQEDGFSLLALSITSNLLLNI